MRRINLQLFAESAAAQTAPEGEQANQQPTTAEELKAQLAQANAKIAKLRLRLRTQPKQSSLEKG